MTVFEQKEQMLQPWKLVEKPKQILKVIGPFSNINLLYYTLPWMTLYMAESMFYKLFKMKFTKVETQYVFFDLRFLSNKTDLLILTFSVPSSFADRRFNCQITTFLYIGTPFEDMGPYPTYQYV